MNSIYFSVGLPVDVYEVRSDGSQILILKDCKIIDRKMDPVYKEVSKAVVEKEPTPVNPKTANDPFSNDPFSDDQFSDVVKMELVEDRSFVQIRINGFQRLKILFCNQLYVSSSRPIQFSEKILDD